MKKRIILLMAVLVTSISLAACGGDEKETSNNDADIVADLTEIEDGSETEGEESEEPESLPEGVYRSELTNELIDEELKDQRPIAVMVDNESIALPHYGLTQADVVYEMMNSLENGRITRLMALVKDYDAITQFGSIRSTRSTNVILAAEWNAILVHDGGPGCYVDQYLAEPCSDNFSGGFSRIPNGKSYEFTEYIAPGDMDSKFDGSNVSKTYNQYYQGEHFKFAKADNAVDLSKVSGSEKAEAIALPFPHNSSKLDYKKEDGLYYYSEYGAPHLDPANNNEQLSFTNVILQSCDYEVYDENGYMIYNCIGSGKGYYITGGNAVEISWKKSSMNEITHFYDADGNEIELNTGKTYIGLVPSDKWSELTLN